MNLKQRAAATILTASLAAISVAACTPPKVSQAPPVARPPCQEETGDQTPKVLEFAWTYPVPPNLPQQTCQPKNDVTQLDVWISLAEGSTIASLLCNSIGGIPWSPGGIKPGQVWLVCRGVPGEKLGIPGFPS